MGIIETLIPRTVSLASTCQDMTGCGRSGTLRCSLERFASRVGDPHEAAPREHWRNYSGHDLLDGAGKVSAIWYFTTPRGPVEVHDYWWNGDNELSLAARDRRALLWFMRWARLQGLEEQEPEANGPLSYAGFTVRPVAPMTQEEVDRQHRAVSLALEDGDPGEEHDRA